MGNSDSNFFSMASFIEFVKSNLKFILIGISVGAIIAAGYVLKAPSLYSVSQEFSQPNFNGNPIEPLDVTLKRFKSEDIYSKNLLELCGFSDGNRSHALIIERIILRSNGDGSFLLTYLSEDRNIGVACIGSLIKEFNQIYYIKLSSDYLNKFVGVKPISPYYVSRKAVTPVKSYAFLVSIFMGLFVGLGFAIFKNLYFKFSK